MYWLVPDRYVIGIGVCVANSSVLVGYEEFHRDNAGIAQWIGPE